MHKKSVENSNVTSLEIVWKPFQIPSYLAPVESTKWVKYEEK